MISVNFAQISVGFPLSPTRTSFGDLLPFTQKTTDIKLEMPAHHQIHTQFTISRAHESLGRPQRARPFLQPQSRTFSCTSNHVEGRENPSSLTFYCCFFVPIGPIALQFAGRARMEFPETCFVLESECVYGDGRSQELMN